MARCMPLFPYLLFSVTFSTTSSSHINLLHGEKLIYPLPLCPKLTLTWKNIYIYSLQVFFIWCFSWFRLFVKDFPQWMQANGFSPVWVLLWHFNAPGCVNETLHIVHEYGLNPEWIFSWVYRLLAFINPLSQCLHENFFWMEWVCLWLYSPWEILKVLPHKLQEKGLLSSWIVEWLFRLILVKKDFSHWLHEYGLTLDIAWVFWWCWYELAFNDFWHKLQFMLSLSWCDLMCIFK